MPSDVPRGFRAVVWGPLGARRSSFAVSTGEHEMNDGSGKVRVIAGMPTTQEVHPEGSMPGITPDFVKLLKEQGFMVDVAVPREDREYVDLNSAEIWLPILIFAAQPAWDLTVMAVVGSIKSWYSKRKVSGDEDVELPPGLLHLRCTFEEDDGSHREFEAHGPAADVIKSLKAFGQVD